LVTSGSYYADFSQQVDDLVFFAENCPDAKTEGTAGIAVGWRVE
jgi:hypothetical protein